MVLHAHISPGEWTTGPLVAAIQRHWQIGYDWVRLKSQNCGLYGAIIHPRVIAMWTKVWWYWLGLIPNLSKRALWQPPILSGGPVSRDISGASRRMDEGNKNLVYLSPWDFKKFLTYRKILWHGTCGFTSHSKEGMLRIFIALKNPSPWPGSNLRALGPVPSTLTTTPPRRLRDIVSPHQHEYHHDDSKNSSRTHLCSNELWNKSLVCTACTVTYQLNVSCLVHATAFKRF
jgi:hypothetical protein